MLLRSIGFMIPPSSYQGDRMGRLGAEFSLISFIFDCAKNYLVDQLLDRSAIIGKIDCTRMLLTYVARNNAFLSHTFEQRIGQTGRIYHEIVKRRWRVGADYHAISEACRIYDIDIRIDRVHRLRQRLYQPKI